MKKIGVLFGMEDSFPTALVETVNARNVSEVRAEAVRVDQVVQGHGTEYAVILDRISHDVPFYRSYLKNAALCGTAVLNNPFWWSADEKFFNNALAVKIGIPVPNTVLLPSREIPPNTKDSSFRNLKYPLNWESIFSYIGFPAYMKPYDGGGWKGVSRLENAEAFFEAYNTSGTAVMLLQSEVVFDFYFRCYCLAGDQVRIMYYDPRKPFHLRYSWDGPEAPSGLIRQVHDYTVALNQALGYDFNTVEWAVKDGIPYAIDFCNPSPDAEPFSVGEKNFQWVVEHAADMVIQRAQIHREGVDNLTWGTFVTNSVQRIPHLRDTQPVFRKALQDAS